MGHRGLLIGLMLSACAPSPTRVSLDAFAGALAERDGATLSLEKWCATRGFADPAQVTAIPVRDSARPLPADLRAALTATHDEPIAYRHVRLACGGRVLSEAYNWYVPARLPDAMNRMLAATDTPFGKVVGPLHFTRERLSNFRGAAAGCPAGTVLSNVALLRLPDGQPLSAVVECYTPANLR